MCVSRRIKHVTFLLTISAAGDAYFPTIFWNDAKANDIFNKGIRKGIDLTIIIGNTSYVTKETFTDYVSSNFIPLVIETRKIDGCADKPALLFYDNCQAHIDEDLLRNLAENKILVITYPPHTSQIFQALDRLTFSLIKEKKRHALKDDDENPLIDHIRRIFKGYEESTTSENVRAAFTHTGFNQIEIDGVKYLQVDEDKIRNFSEFKEIWEINFPEENLTPRRKNQRWGWINEEFFPEEFRRMIQEIE